MVERWKNSFKREAGLFYKGTNHTFEGSTSWPNHLRENPLPNTTTFVVNISNICIVRKAQLSFANLKWYLTMDLDLHFFMSLLAICVSSLEICPFKVFEIQLFASCCWGVRGLFYVLDINPLSDVWFANIFFHFMV